MATKSLLIPVGHLIGAYHDLPVSDDHFVQVRVGPAVVRLKDEQFAMWALAHGAPDRPPDRPWGRKAVLDAARRARIPGAKQVLDSLITDSLIFEVTPGADSAVDFARAFRMVPLMLGLGNTAEHPGLYSVGMIGQPWVSMSAGVYDLYEWAHMDSNLWLACQGAAATALRVGIQDPEATDPRVMLDALLSMLHFLLTPNAVYFDTRRAG